MNPNAPSHKSMEKTKKALFKWAMEGNWDEVKREYEDNPDAHKARITRSGDTALHIAIADGQESIVKDLVDKISKGSPDRESALTVKNERGNTPLHFAASQGNVNMCKDIVGRDTGLIGIRNKESETPFFLAVLNGRTDAFLCLHRMMYGEREGYAYSWRNDDEKILTKGYEYSRRNDGETILHSAIAGEYFDLAFKIIHLYGKLVNYVNQKGFSPLHLLASKPSCFKSGSHIRGYQKIIYHCIFVDKLELNFEEDNTLLKGLEYKPDAKYPENYQTCVGFVLFLRNIFQVLVGHSSNRKKNTDQADKEKQQDDPEQAQGSSKVGAQGHQLVPPNYLTCFHAAKLLSKSMLVILGLGSNDIEKLRRKKENHIWSTQIMDKLLELTSAYEYEDNGTGPQHLPSQRDDVTTPYALSEGGIATFVKESLSEPMPLEGEKEPLGQKLREVETGETPILIAAKNGVKEMVKEILRLFPVALHDTNAEKKNIVLLSVENRQPHVYKYLLDKKIMKEIIFRRVDKDGNSALHLAAKQGVHRPWLIPGSALQMQWEIKWYEFVKNSMPLHFFTRYNAIGQTPNDIFTETHKDLVKEGGKWLSSTANSCSLVAALIATVAFATSSTVPGGVRQETGIPTLENESAFSIFAISSLVALCFSITSLVMFLSILTSRYQEKDFGRGLPKKLLVGLTSLFVSIAAMLVSFCAGHFFVLKDKLQYAAFPVYAVSCLPITFFAVAQFPLYFDLMWATFAEVPQRSYK